MIGAMKEDYNETVFEISDLVYHILVLMVEMGIDLSQVRQELENRHVVDKKSNRNGCSKIRNLGGSAMFYSNAHTHSTWCDGKDSLEDMAQAAIELGFTDLGFTCHHRPCLILAVLGYRMK